MKFKFVGDDHSPSNKDVTKVSAYGYDFELDGEYVDVTDARALEKIKKNPAFRAEGDPNVQPAGDKVTPVELNKPVATPEPAHAPTPGAKEEDAHGELDGNAKSDADADKDPSAYGSAGGGRGSKRK